MIERHHLFPDGRRLCYAEYGVSNGTRVMYFHGSPACRLEPLLIGEEALCRAGLCVVAPDRPGLGGSDFKPGRGFSDWPQDVACLADHLGWKRFSVLGNSGGAPYAAVCAAKIPERVDHVVIVSGGWQMRWPEARQHLPPATAQPPDPVPRPARPLAARLDAASYDQRRNGLQREGIGANAFPLGVGGFRGLRRGR